MPSRRYHRKTRLGCTECKRRRVKCDEQRPSCGGCVRVGAACHYEYGQIVFLSGSPSSGGSGTPTPHHDASSVIHREHALSHPAFDLVDLALMNYYSTETSLQLFHGALQCRFWQREIPALAASNSMVMHGILALAALHRARVDISERSLYQARALQHYDAGLRPFQRAMATPSPEDAEALVSFAIMLGVWVFAFPETAAERLCAGELLTILELIRSTRGIFTVYRDSIVGKPISVFLNPPLLSIEPCSLPECVPGVKDLLETLRERVCRPSDLLAVERLYMLLERYLTGRDHQRATAGWVVFVDDEYWARLRGYDPVAVLIFAHASLLPRCLQKECWWVAGWSERIVKACEEVLRSEDKEALQWDATVTAIRKRGDELANYAIPVVPD